MARSFTREEYVSALEAIGWLAALPVDARRKLNTQLAKKFRTAGGERLSAKVLYSALSVTSFDAEMIEGWGPKSECSYHSLVRQLAEHSFGQDPRQTRPAREEGQRLLRARRPAPPHHRALGNRLGRRSHHRGARERRPMDVTARPHRQGGAARRIRSA
jgi:hypothetical protein